MAAVGPENHFFELGGHASLTASAVALLGDRLGIAVRPNALFAAPTPAKTTDRIAELGRECHGAPGSGITPFFPD